MRGFSSLRALYLFEKGERLEEEALEFLNKWKKEYNELSKKGQVQGSIC